MHDRRIVVPYQATVAWGNGRPEGVARSAEPLCLLNIFRMQISGTSCVCYVRHSRSLPTATPLPAHASRSYHVYVVRPDHQHVQNWVVGVVAPAVDDGCCVGFAAMAAWGSPRSRLHFLSRPMLSFRDRVPPKDRIISSIQRPSQFEIYLTTQPMNPPWEPYPERKRKLEERARRPKSKANPRVPGGKNAGSLGRRRNRNPATDSSISSSSSADDHARGADGVVAGYDTDSVASSCGSYRKGLLKSGDSHVRARPGNCSCLQDGGCGDEDGCCAEDLPGVEACPCFDRVSTAGVVEVSTKGRKWVL